MERANRPRLYRRRRALLRLGVAAPLLAAGSVVCAVLAYPGFDHGRQYLSELGGAGAVQPLWFNAGVFAAGVLAAGAGLGFGLALAVLGRARAAGVLTALAFVLAGAGLVVAALYPHPDVRHGWVNLGLGIQLAPLSILWGLARQPGFGRLKLFLAVVFLITAALTLITRHLVFPGMVNDANVGWWERVFAVALVGWVAVCAYVLERRIARLETLD